MLLSKQWLHEWLDFKIDAEALSKQLTMAGLEVDTVKPAAGDFSGVVVGRVVSAHKHPDADRLNVCKVDTGDGDLIDVVCGGVNVREGLKVAFAKVGAVLPGNFKIKKAKLRGSPSHGMICSTSELGMGEGEAHSIMELSEDAPLGETLQNYLQLHDYIYDIELTPNRGDCLSIKGVARDLAVLNDIKLQLPEIQLLAATVQDERGVTLSAPQQCPHYVGRVIKGVNMRVSTPIMMQERLRRAGLRSINFIVDVTNFVMLEMGQPMHAFDVNKVAGDIDVRLAKKDERLRLLDDQDITLRDSDLVIADANGPIALAGIMGGLASSVDDSTQDIFLESAYFTAPKIMLSARAHGLQTDSSYRFERGIDFDMQRMAIERASELIVSHAGGELGAVVDVLDDMAQPKPVTTVLRRHRIKRLLGVEYEDAFIEKTLEGLGLTLVSEDDGWQLTIPSHRPDMTMEADVIEELVRVYGYDHIPEHAGHVDMRMPSVSETESTQGSRAAIMRGLGYHEAMTYSFISREQYADFSSEFTAIEIANPMGSEMAVMRSSLLPGLVGAVAFNIKHQNVTARLFEQGACFYDDQGATTQIQRIAAMITGASRPVAWQQGPRNVDFFDLKGDLQALAANLSLDVTFEPSTVSVFHPGRQAAVMVGGNQVGVCGQLHPDLAKKYEIKQEVYLFELDSLVLSPDAVQAFSAISKYPAMRRDLAIVVENEINNSKIQAVIYESAGDLLQSVEVFDIYKGEGVPEGHKSIALCISFQSTERTLVDDDINVIIQRIVDELASNFNAQLRA
jgi:phenylalanyl-tRNA synthetase beta chain